MATESPTKARDKAARLALTERDRRLLEFVRRFRLLTRDQAMALAPFGSLTRANTRLAALLKARLLSRKALPIYPGNGSAQALYFLGPASSGLLDVDPGWVARQIRQASRWELAQVEHLRAANQVLIDFLSVLESAPESRLLAFRTEPELRQIFLNEAFVPDGWIAWFERTRRFNAFLEVDRNHEGLNEWRKKIRCYAEYRDSGLHQQGFSFRSFRVLVLAKGKRVENLRRLAQASGRLFLFAELDRVSADNILGKAWWPASGDSPIRLTEA